MWRRWSSVPGRRMPGPWANRAPEGQGGHFGGRLNHSFSTRWTNRRGRWGRAEVAGWAHRAGALRHPLCRVPVGAPSRPHGSQQSCPVWTQMAWPLFPLLVSHWRGCCLGRDQVRGALALRQVLEFRLCSWPLGRKPSLQGVPGVRLHVPIAKTLVLGTQGSVV